MAGHWTQIKVPNAPFRSGGHTLTYDSFRERMVLFGGPGGNPVKSSTKETWEWDGKNWVEVADFGPSDRNNHSAAFNSDRGRVLIFGGERDTPNNNFEQTVFADPWEWSGSDWSKLPEFGPPKRFGSALSYDAKRKKMVLFGGAGRDQTGSSQGGVPGASEYDARTWEWDGLGWAVAASGGPPARHGHCMAFDSGRGRIVLFGGALHGPPPKGQEVHSTSFFGDTWEWDGRCWTQMSDIGPAARGFHSMAYDPDRGRVVLFSGQISTDENMPFTMQMPGDTWEWNGHTWAQVADSGPGHLAFTAMAYDRARHQMTLFGGAGIGTNQDIWIWNPGGK